MPEHAMDVMLGVLGSSVGLGGLLLVFCGFVFAQAAGFPPATTDDAIIDRYKRAARLGMWPFLGSIVNSLGVVVWFLCPSRGLYLAAVGFFALLLVVTGIYGVVVTRSYL